MTITPSEETKAIFTPEQRLALARVYGFLMDLGRQRLNRLNGNVVPSVFAGNDEVSAHEPVPTGNETQTGQ